MKPVWRKATFFLALLLVSIGIVSLAGAEEPPLPLNSQAGHPVLSAMLEASRIGRFYRIQPGASEVGFHVDSKFQNVQGRFRQFKGGIALEPGSGDNGQAVFIVKSDSVSTSNSVVDRVIKSDMFFDAGAYPDIRVSPPLKSAAATRSSDFTSREANPRNKNGKFATTSR